MTSFPYEQKVHFSQETFPDNTTILQHPWRTNQVPMCKIAWETIIAQETKILIDTFGGYYDAIWKVENIFFHTNILKPEEANNTINAGNYSQLFTYSEIQNGKYFILQDSSTLKYSIPQIFPQYIELGKIISEEEYNISPLPICEKTINYHFYTFVIGFFLLVILVFVGIWKKFLKK